MTAVAWTTLTLYIPTGLVIGSSLWFGSRLGYGVSTGFYKLAIFKDKKPMFKSDPVFVHKIVEECPPKPVGWTYRLRNASDFNTFTYPPGPNPTWKSEFNGKYCSGKSLPKT